MKNLSYKYLIEKGMSAAEHLMSGEDRIWARYSNDKVDIGEELGKIFHTLFHTLPLSQKMRVLSLGSSIEPQFRILENLCRGGMYLLDIDYFALKLLQERISRQHISHVFPIKKDYTILFTQKKCTLQFYKDTLKNRPCDLITLHHSLYYSKETLWEKIIKNIYQHVLSPQGAIHAVMMSCTSHQKDTTSWIYNHFIGKYFGIVNTQDLLKLTRTLKKDPFYKNAPLYAKTHKVSFFAPDFAQFMAVIWMILLYPHVHSYTKEQRQEITEYMYHQFWKKQNPLLQLQDHLVIYKGIEKPVLV